MHIPDSLLHGTVCPLSAACAAAGLGAAALYALRSTEKPAPLRFAALTALVFSAQMLNYPVDGGTSGHLIGASLAVFLLGGPFGILSLALVLTVQALLFADGGIGALGANLLNMALLASLPAILARRLSGDPPARRRLPRAGAAFLSGWLSVLLASTACSLELAASGGFALGTVLPAMTGVHALIGLGEGLATALILVLASAADRGFLKAGTETALVALSGAALLASPLASSFPDGLERVAAGLGAAPEGGSFAAPLAEYLVPGLGAGALSGILAGGAGAVLCFAAALLLGSAMRGKRAPEGSEGA